MKSPTRRARFRALAGGFPRAWLLAPGCVLILASCYSAAKTFEGFQQSSTDIDSVVLLHEVMIQRDIQGQRHVIHEIENIQSLECIHNAVKERVIEKGYDVSDRSIRSIGLTEKPETPILVFHGNEGEWPGFFSPEQLVQERSPIWVQSSGFDESDVLTVGALHRHLKAESELIREMKGTYYSFYTNKIELPRNSVLMVTQSFGEQVFTGKKLTEWAAIILGGLASGSTGVASPQHDSTTHYLFVLRSDTGELLWADYFDEMGGNRGEAALRSGVKKLLDDLPDKDSK